MGTWQFTPNQAGIDESLRGPKMAQMLTSLAAAGAAATEPRGANRKGTIVAEPAVNKGGTLQARFGSTSSFWHLEEFGSVNNRPYRTLTKAAISLGLVWQEARP